MEDSEIIAPELRDFFNTVTKEVAQRFASRKAEMDTTQEHYTDAETSAHTLKNTARYAYKGWTIQATNSVQHGSFYVLGYGWSDVTSHWIIKGTLPRVLFGFAFEMDRNSWFNRVFLRRYARTKSSNTRLKRGMQHDEVVQRHFRSTFLKFHFKGSEHPNNFTIETTFTIDQHDGLKITLALEAMESIIRVINRTERINEVD